MAPAKGALFITAGLLGLARARHDVILVERRVPWDAPDTPFGPQWPDRNTRWHLVDDVPAATSVGALLDTVDDPRRAFYR